MAELTALPSKSTVIVSPGIKPVPVMVSERPAGPRVLLKEIAASEINVKLDVIKLDVLPSAST